MTNHHDDDAMTDRRSGRRWRSSGAWWRRASATPAGAFDVQRAGMSARDERLLVGLAAVREGTGAPCRRRRGGRRIAGPVTYDETHRDRPRAGRFTHQVSSWEPGAYASPGTSWHPGATRAVTAVLEAATATHARSRSPRRLDRRAAPPESPGGTASSSGSRSRASARVLRHRAGWPAHRSPRVDSIVLTYRALTTVMEHRDENPPPGKVRFAGAFFHRRQRRSFHRRVSRGRGALRHHGGERRSVLPLLDESSPTRRRHRARHLAARTHRCRDAAPGPGAVEIASAGRMARGHAGRLRLACGVAQSLRAARAQAP